MLCIDLPKLFILIPVLNPGLTTHDNVYEPAVSPAYEGIANRLPANGETGIQTIHNPVYTDRVVHQSTSERAPDPFYAELGPIYFTLHSGRSMRVRITPRVGAPLRPSTESGSSMSQDPSPYLVPQPSSKTANRSVQPNNDLTMKNCPSPYCVPSTQSSENGEVITGGVPEHPTSNEQDVTVANDPEYLQLQAYRSQPPSVIAVKESIEIKDDSPPLKLDGNVQEQETNNLKSPGPLDKL